MTAIEPIYIEHCDLPATRKSQSEIALDLCEKCEKLANGQILGAQCMNGVWAIRIKSVAARSHIINNIKHLQINNINIDIHNKYPTATSVPNEKIVFRDVPFNVHDQDILQYLHNQPGVFVKTGVMAAKLRDKNNKLTNYLSGDRFVYVKGKFSPALPTIATLSSAKCKVWHKSQTEVCQRCRHFGHQSVDTEKCPAFHTNADVITIRSPNFVLCNYYMCEMKVFDQEFPSSEHAFQYRFLKHVGLDDLAEEVLVAPSAAAAKAIASRVPSHLHRDWHSIKLRVMKDILHARQITVLNSEILH